MSARPPAALRREWARFVMQSITRETCTFLKPHQSLGDSNCFRARRGTLRCGPCMVALRVADVLLTLQERERGMATVHVLRGVPFPRTARAVVQAIKRSPRTTHVPLASLAEVLTPRQRVAAEARL